MFRFASRFFSEEVKRSKPEYIYGVNPVLAALSANRRFNTTLYLNIAEKGDRKSSDKITQIQRMATSKNMKIKYLTKMALQKFTGGRPCQNVVMKVDKMTYADIRSMKDIPITKETGKFILFLDQITDPQNFGSIVRSAMFLGVDAIVVNKRNACGLTPVVSKVSSGALEFAPIYSVKFVSKFFMEAQSKLNFKIVSTNLDDESSDFVNERDPDEKEEVQEDDDFDAPVKVEQKLVSLDSLKIDRSENVMLVLGSEGEGVSRTISRMADFKVVIPPELQMAKLGKYPYNMVDSLNVGVSAALLIYHIKHQSTK